MTAIVAGAVPQFDPIATVDPITTVAPMSSSASTRALRPAAANAAAAAGACSSLVSISRCPPGASQRGAPSATAPQHVEPVRPAVERDPRLVVAGFGGHRRDRGGRDVGHVRNEHVDTSEQRRRQRVEQVSRPRRAPPGRLRRAQRDRDRIDVGGVELDSGHGRGDGRPDRAGTAAQVGDDRPWRVVDQRDGVADEQLGAPPRHEHARADLDAQSAELDPADDVLERLAAAAPSGELLELGR